MMACFVNLGSGVGLNDQAKQVVYNIADHLRIQKKVHKLPYNVAEVTSEATGLSTACVYAVLKEMRVKEEIAAKTITVRGKKIIYNVIKYCDEEKEKRKLKIPIFKATERAAAATGFSDEIISTVRNESMKETLNKEIPVTEEERRIISSVIRYFDKEQKLGYIMDPIDNVNKRISIITGFMEGTINRIRREGMIADSHGTEITPGLRKKRKRRVISTDDQRSAFENFIKNYRQEYEHEPSLKELFKVGREKFGITGGKEWLRKTLSDWGLWKIGRAAKRKVDSQEDSSSEPKKKTQRKNPQRSSRKNEQNEDPLQAEEVMIKTEPVESDDDTSGFETVTVPGCSTWTEESDDEESSESENVLSSDEPKTDAPADGQDVCRLCMSSEKLFGIFDPVSVQLNLASKITDVSAIPIQKGDGLPQLICPPCAAAVQNFYDFKVQCAVTDVTLKAEHKKETLDQIISSKNKSDLTEFQKLNMRLKANLQCFYDIVDAINELQDKTQREVGNFSGIVLKMSTSAVESKDSKGKKRKKATPAWPQILAKQTTSVSETVTSETIPTPTAVPESIVSDAANSNVGVNIKVEPDPDLEMETVPEASFVSQIDDMLVTKLEYEDTFCNSETMSDDPGLPNTDMLSFDESAGRALESFQEGARVSLTTLESVCPTDFRTNEQVPKIDSTYSNGK